MYVELADQYKDMDPVSDVPKRNLLAQHLREVVDILEQKVCKPWLDLHALPLSASQLVYFYLGGSNCILVRLVNFQGQTRC